jgi:two-component system, LytTR family, sensor kinase
MSGLNIAGLTNLLGYTVAIALYLMLLVMVLKHPAQSTTQPAQASFYSGWSNNALLLLTAVLGVLWNIGALAIYGLKAIGYENSYPIVAAISFTALGFLPAVVVHSVLRGQTATNPRLAKLLAVAAYSLSASAGILQFYDATLFGLSPSLWALRLLTFGYVALLTTLFISTRRQEGWKKAIWASALAVFAVSALHLSHHQGAGTDSWFVEITGHHASLPLVLAILYEDYRFAFADIFLKQALSLLILVTLAFALYLGVATPALAGRNATDPAFVGLLLGLWVTTALLYPWLSRVVAHFVDTIVLRRVHYGTVRAEVAQILNTSETAHEIMDQVRDVVTRAVSARAVNWVETDSPVPAYSFQHPTDRYVHLLEGSGNKGASVFVPTAEAPYFKFEIGILAGGRRLLSDDIGMLESVVIMVARRIDALRVTHERCEQNLREQEINKLATEAQLRALRAQVNPHFLFNALTTIGYLIQTAPDRALETLMKLTSLLRGVLRTDEVVTLQEELDLIGSYLDIERARFEERLRVSIDVPENLRSLQVPPLIIQPLVENAIKHGITPARLGGEVTIKAQLEQANGRGSILNIIVSDSGIGVSELDLTRNRRRGLGLSNIEERLRWYGGQSSSLRIKSQPGEGTTVELRLPLLERTTDGVFPATQTDIKERRKA